MYNNDEVIAKFEEKYGLSKMTVEFLLDMYGEELLETYIIAAKKQLGDKWSEAQVINICEELASPKMEVTKEVDTSFLTKEDPEVTKRINVINRVINYALLIVLTAVGSALLSVVLHINFKYLVFFCITFALILITFNIFDLAKEKKTREEV